MKDTTIAVDLCKERLRDCHLARSGEGVQATPCESTQVGVVFAKQSAATVLLEACGSARASLVPPNPENPRKPRGKPHPSLQGRNWPDWMADGAVWCYPVSGVFAVFSASK